MNVGLYNDFAVVAQSVCKIYIFKFNIFICLLVFKVEVSMQLTSGDPLFKV